MEIHEAVDAPTRERVARTILELGPSTAAALAERLDLTPAAVRRHLDHMLAEGAVEAREPRVYGTRGRGRPAKVFAITEHRPRPVRPAVRRPGRPGAAVPRGDRRRRRGPRVRPPPGRRHRDALRRDRRGGARSSSRPRPSPRRSPRVATLLRSARARSASSSASSTAPSRTSPTSSPSCARPRPRSSPRSSAGTSSGWPPSPTATGSAPPASRPPEQRRTSHRHRHTRG